MTARTRTVFLGDAEVEVRYDFQPYEAMTRDYPGCRAEVTINELLINGEWIDTEHFSKAWISKAENDLLAAIDEDLRERDLL